MSILVPNDIINRFDSIKLVKAKSNNYIFSGKNKDKGTIIKIRPYPQKVFLEFTSKYVLPLRIFLNKIEPIRNKTWFTSVSQIKLYSENNYMYVTIEEPEYIPLVEYLTGKVMENIPIDKVVSDITRIWTELQSWGLYHNDIAVRNICYNPEIDMFILIDYENISDEPDDFSPARLRKELNRLND